MFPIRRRHPSALVLHHVFCGSCTDRAETNAGALAPPLVSPSDSRDRTLTAVQAKTTTYALSPKQLRQLKHKLLKPTKARKIVKDLKALPDTPESRETRAFSLPSISGSIALLPVSPGTLAGLQAAQRSGALDLIATATATVLDSSGKCAPADRVSVFLYWWGYELAIPASEMAKLRQVRNVQNTLFQFLQAFALLQAPELTPFTKAISNYFDVELGLIRSQDRGQGVVLAATWLLPLALVPRPWDFASDGTSHNDDLQN